jgi:MarR family transcriptional regulator, organic hydroperoxide resistance regulator
MNQRGEKLSGLVRRQADPADSEFELSLSPFFWLSRVSGRYILDLEAVFKPIEMDVPRWRVLMILMENNPASVSAIAELAVIKLSTMTRIIQRMQSDGLVTCAPRPTDARVTEVHLTATGRAGVGRVCEQASRVFHRAVHGVSDGELLVLLDLLRRLYENMGSSPV